jgi:hypothetical protein
MEFLKMKTNIALCAFAVILQTFLSCASAVDKAGGVLDGSAFAYKTLSVYRPSPKSEASVSLARSKDGSDALIIVPTGFPALLLYGTVPDADGNFFLTHYTFFTSGTHGWNEFTMDIAGQGSFTVSGQSARLTLKAVPPMAAIETLQISGGKIRRGSNRLTGSAALTALRNRKERIASLTDWMAANESAIPSFANQKEFEAYWKPILLPEMVAAKKRPASFSKEGVRVRAEDVNWNTTYTARLFPEDIRALRDSGALLRDWEEAAAWIYLEYRWNFIVQSLTEGMTLSKQKK